MKNLQYFIFAIGLSLATIACEKNELIEENPETAALAAEVSSADYDNKEHLENWLNSNSKSNGLYREYQVPSSCSNNQMLFVVSGAPSTAAVKMTSTASGRSSYYNMSPSIQGRDFQEVAITLPYRGEWEYEYVDSRTRQRYPSANTYTLRNTAVNMNADRISNLNWPFGNDNTSWADRNEWTDQYNDRTPLNAKDKYFQRWRFGRGHTGLGKMITAPLEGRVVYAADSPEYGRMVDILHEQDGRTYLFRVAHLQEIEVEKGDLVDNETIIGSLGRTGDVNPQQPNAYCVLYEVDRTRDRIIRSIPFQFDAICR